MEKIKHLLGTMRVPFLILTPACILLGVAAAVKSAGQINIFHLILVLIGAISAHISVNTFNEYFDFKSGLDFITERTPFSGGSGNLKERPDMSKQVLKTAIISFTVTAVIGLYFLYLRGWMLLPLGVLGLLILFVYTPWLTRNPILCLIVPGLGFGPIMVMGTYFVLAGHYSWMAFIVSLLPFGLVSNLLLLNQFPDVDADKIIGRRHLPIILGKKKSSLVYGLLLLSAYFSVVLGVFLHLLPWASLIGLMTIAIAVPTFIGVFRHAENTKLLVPYMALNVVISIVTPVIVAIGLIMG